MSAKLDIPLYSRIDDIIKEKIIRRFHLRRVRLRRLFQRNIGVRYALREGLFHHDIEEIGREFLRRLFRRAIGQIELLQDVFRYADRLGVSRKLGEEWGGWSVRAHGVEPLPKESGGFRPSRLEMLLGRRVVLALYSLGHYIGRLVPRPRDNISPPRPAVYAAFAL